MKLDGAEVARHNTKAKGAWLAVHNEVWDVTGMVLSRKDIEITTLMLNI